MPCAPAKFSGQHQDFLKMPKIEVLHLFRWFTHTHMHINLKENFRLPCNHCETRIRQIRLGQTSTSEVKYRSQHFKNKNRLDSCWKQVSTPFTTACTEFQTHMSVVSAQCRCNWNANYIFTTQQKPKAKWNQRPKAKSQQKPDRNQKPKEESQVGMQIRDFRSEMQQIGNKSNILVPKWVK